MVSKQWRPDLNTDCLTPGAKIICITPLSLLFSLLKNKFSKSLYFYFWINKEFCMSSSKKRVNSFLSKCLAREIYSVSSNNLELICMNVCGCVYFLHFCHSSFYIKALFSPLIGLSGLTCWFCLLCFMSSFIFVLSNILIYLLSKFVPFGGYSALTGAGCDPCNSPHLKIWKILSSK